jgi:hypothetical protein
VTLTNVGGEPVDPARDRPGLVVRTLLGATLAGTSSVALVLWGVRTLIANQPPAVQSPATGPAFPLLVGGVLSSALLAAGVAWWRLAPLTAIWRRGVFSMISALGTIVGALAATPIHYHFGDKGLLILAAGTALIAIGALWAAGARPSGA